MNGVGWPSYDVNDLGDEVGSPKRTFLDKKEANLTFPTFIELDT